jgi:NADH-quinone oxidoreductase subunit F
MINSATDNTILDGILADKGRGPEDVLHVLQAVQAQYHYLPEAALRYICDHSGITPSAMTSVATFYKSFRHKPAGQHMVNVCVGTACHVKGANRIIDALRRHLRLEEDEDTDQDNRFTIQSVNCLGCCSLAPVVQIDDVIYGYATTENVGGILDDFLLRQKGTGKTDWTDAIASHTDTGDIRIGMGSCCVASGAADIEAALRTHVKAIRVPVRIQRVACMGLTYEEPLIEISQPDAQPTLYAKVKPEDIPSILHAHFPAPRPLDRLRQRMTRVLETMYTGADQGGLRCFKAGTRDPEIRSYLDPQLHIATESNGDSDPVNINEYCSTDGFAGLRHVLETMRSDEVIDIITNSGLRGRGGGGYPTGRKWRAVAEKPNNLKYIVCNGDEGDPGAFMDRMLLESHPFRVIEGMLIAAYATGASQGILYIRAEYPLAVERITAAIAACRSSGWLGHDIQGYGFDFDLQIEEGAGAFVCGEETALIASLEGRRGMPHLRPPWPSEQGLHGCPTLINNTETFSLIPWITRHGADAFKKIGTAQSKGTKVFALAGKVRRGGLIEVPMGMTIRQVIEDIGGGMSDGHPFKAVLIGGPSGGCIPARLADTPIDYEALLSLGAMMGSGGLVALDETDCMVEMARYFMAFAQDESCGKCTFCRVGTKRMLTVLTRICAGQGSQADIVALEQLGTQIRSASLCGLGRTAPNPVLTMLRYFREEVDAHIAGICPAGQCKALISYEITDACIGCTRCAQRCPADAIACTPYEKHHINQDACVRCNACLPVCPQSAIVIKSGERIVRQGKPRSQTKKAEPNSARTDPNSQTKDEARSEWTQNVSECGRVS